MIAPGVPGALGLIGAERSDRFVYFAERGGQIKIGCSLDPVRRMRDLGARLMGVVGGGFWLEKAYHRHFAADALGHEWFAPSATLLAFIAHLPTDPAGARSWSPGDRYVFVDGSDVAPDLPVPVPASAERDAALAWAEAS